MPATESPAPTLVLAAGASAAERRLLDGVVAAVESRDAALRDALGKGDAAAAADLLARPFRIVVSSRSLREHVAAALARRAGRALAAVKVETHWSLALQVIERAGETAPRGDALFGVELRRAARAEPALVESLDALRDGYGVVEATARDLVDAGFERVHADALDESLSTGASTAARERARAVVRATAQALARLEVAGVAPRAAVLRRATELVESRGEASIPTAGLWIHGFADATGVVTGWLLALLRSFGATAIVGVPPDPFASGQAEREFSQPLVERLGAIAKVEAEADDSEPASLARLRAPGANAELRGVATRVRALLDRGVAPEAIAVVARDPRTYRSAIAAQLGRLAIPYSTHGFVAAPSVAHARGAALLRLLADAALAPLDAWLTASAHAADASQDLRVGLHVLGMGRLGEWVALDLATALTGDRLVLPVRRGASDDAEANGSRRRARSRSIARADLESAQERARAISNALAAWPPQASFGARREALEALLATQLGWNRAQPEEAAFFEALDGLAAEIPAAYELDRDELALLLAATLEAGAAGSVGGRGAGVQVLSATAARGRSFEHGFVLGMNRDHFPRKPSLDPLLPDAFRQAMRSVLPELPIKARARAEERHLFAELLSAGRAMTLSWQFATEQGRECARSSFLERLPQRGGADDRVAPLERDAAALRRAHDHLVRAGLFGARASLGAIRSEALREAGARDPDALAATHMAVLAELDPDRRAAAHLSPYAGRLGAPRAAPDAAVYVTAIEGDARCAWRRFLSRDLGLAPAPDALEALPSLSALAIGSAVHAALERIVAEAGAATGVSLDAAFAQGPVLVPWPDDARLAAIAREASEEAARDAGIRSAAFVRALVQTVRGALEVARDTDWRDPAGLSVLGAELDGEAKLVDATGRTRSIAFRADRADASADWLRITDYKTGRVIDGNNPKARRTKLLASVARGVTLQAAAYLVALRDRPENDVAGRYLFLKPDADADAREHRVGRDDADLVAAFEASARTVLAARDLGAHPPRLVELPKGDEPVACSYCEVAAACLQGDTAARRRQRRWLEAAASDPSALADDERAAVDLLLLGREEPA